MGLISYPSDYNPILAYYEEIELGKVVVSKKVARTYKELVRRMMDENYDYEYDNERANHALEFIENFCKHSKGKVGGKPFLMELWQHALIAAVFGFVHKETRIRMVKEVLLLIGRKNGKSALASAIALYGFIADGELGAEIVSVSTKKDQAKIVWEESKRMVAKSPDLKKRIKSRVSDLVFEKTDSVYKPLASDSNSLDGLNVHMSFIDELHAIKDKNLYDVIVDAMSAREQPLSVITTTAGTVRNGIYDDKYQEMTNIIKGYDDGNYRDDRTIAFMYELDSEEEVHDESCWVKANPMLDIVKDRDEMRRKYRKALAQPTLLKNFLCKEFNLQQNGTSAWLTYEQALNEDMFNLLELRPRYAIGGVDLSRTTDLTSASIMFTFPETNTVYFETMYWLPEDNIELRAEEDGVPYQLWAENGYLRLCEGNQIRLSDVTAWFVEMRDKYDIYLYKVGYDNYSAKYWVDEMEGVFGKIMVPVQQGYKTLSLPMMSLGAAFEKHYVNYNRNPISLWCIGNTTVTVDENGNIKPAKGKGRVGRIDGLASMLDAYVIFYNNQSEYLNLM